MRIMLAPMEGVVDATMRDLLTRMGGYERCVTEFVRITEQGLPARVFLRICPELHTDSRTAAGTPVYVQLLGGNAHYMAENARRLVQLEPLGIDLNFGCPSKTVNRSDGGSVLLREPERVADIVKAVRDAVPDNIPVTAKIRLGFYDAQLFPEIAQRVAEAGATELCVHARTKQQGYQPPAYWSLLAPVVRDLDVPVIVNGDIWSLADAQQALAASGCQALMLGRGALSFPDLARLIQAHYQGQAYTALSARALLPVIFDYVDSFADQNNPRVSNYIKQWFTYLQRQYPEFASAFQQIKRLKSVAEIRDCLAGV